MNRDFITLTPEEEALIKEMEEKYPGMSFSLQPVSLARANEVRAFMRDHLDDPEAQHAAILSGGNWEGGRMAYESVCAAQNEFFINYFESHGLDYPKVPRDAHKSFINRRFEDSEYTEVKTQRDEARTNERLLGEKVEQMVRNIDFLKNLVDDQNLGQLVDDERGREVLEKISELVAALSAHGSAQPAEAKTKPRPAEATPGCGYTIEKVPENEVLDKMHERQDKKEAEQLVTVDMMREKAILDLRPAVPDAAMAGRLLDDVSRPYQNFDQMFTFGFKPYLDSGAFIPGKLKYLVLAAILHPFLHLEKKLTPGSLATYLGRTIGDYRPNAK